MQEAQFALALARDIVQYVMAQGVEVNQLCTAAQIDPLWLEDPDRLVSGEVLKYLWREAIKQTKDSDLGLHIGEAFDLSAIGTVGYVLLNCQTYGQVLEKLSQYTRLFSQGVAINHQICNGWVQCDCEIMGNIKNYLQDEPRHPIESTFAALMTATEQLTGNSISPQSVWFQHPRPLNCSEHQRIFKTSVQFSQSANRIVFDSNCLDWSVRSANTNLLSVFELHASAMLSTQSQTQNYTQKVIEVITNSLQGEVPSIEAIARTLMLSVRQQRARITG